MSETALAIVDGGALEKSESAADLMRRATDAAAVCREAVLRLAVKIGERSYLPVEAWGTIAAAYGCVPSIREVTEEERGVRAVAELRKLDGTVIATAEGYVGLDEPTWANRPLYARRAMAQTRALSRVCRSAFAFVVALMNAGLSTTPHEEVSTMGEVVSPPAKPAPAAAPGQRAPERSKRTQVRFGKSKGKHLCDIEDSDLDWQLAAARKSVEARDPKWHDNNTAWLATVQDEVSRRSGK